MDGFKNKNNTRKGSDQVEIIMSNAEQLIKLLEFNLVNEKFENAKKLLDDEENYGRIIVTHYSDVIQEVVLKHLTADNYIEKPLLYEACEYILNLFAKKCHQQGILFEFLELLETAKDDDVFRSILKALQVILLNQSEIKTRSLEYTLNSVEDYVQELELPKLFNKKYLEEEEEKILENDDKVRRILMNYMTLELFYEPILNQIIDNSSEMSNVFRPTKYNRRNVLFCFILRLLGKPLSHLDLSFNYSDTQNIKSYSREIAEKLVTSLCKLYVNIFDLLKYVEIRCKWKPKDKIDDDLSNIFLHPEKFPLIQVGILFYLIIAEKICYEMTPKVYCHKYIFSSGLYLVHELLSSNESVIPKALKLCRQMLLNIHDSISSVELEDDIHMNFCNNLIKTIIYSPSKSNRQNGLEVLKMYILKFDTAGRYLLIKNVIKSSTHKGLIGYLTTIYKDIIFESIEDEEISQYLCGFNLKQLLFNHICKLENGVQCDLTNSSDQIIAALNFIIGLYLRDKDNKTGIKSLTLDLQSGFLTELRSALDFSRAHFKFEFQKVKSGEADEANKNDAKMVNVEILNDPSGLDEVTRDKKLDMLNSALIMFDLIDFQLARVTEIINRS